MSRFFVLASDPSLKQSESSRVEQALKMVHPRAYQLGKKWSCPVCKKSSTDARRLSREVCK
jgi:hypothetical protein